MRDRARASADAQVAGCLRAFEAESDFVARALRRQGVRPHDVEDLAQDVFLILCRRWRDLDHRRPLRAWLSGVIVKVAQQYRRRVGRFVPAGILDREDGLPPMDDQLGAAWAQTIVSRALARLPEKQRAVVVMHDLDGVPMREVAERLGVPLFTAYTRLRAGRLSLAAAIENRDRDSSVKAFFGVVSRWGVWLSAAAAVSLALVLARAPLWERAVASQRSAGAQPLSPARGLVGHWTFDGAGGVVRDLSGGGNDCLVRSTDGAAHARSIAGVSGQALDLDGKAWLECPHADRLARLGTELTISLWVRIPEDGVDGRQALVTRQLEESGDRLFSLRFQRERVEFLSHVWKTLLGRPYAGRGWTHVAAVRDANGTRLYFDGALAGRTGRITPGSLGGGKGALIVGGQVNGPEPGPAQDRFRGAIDELSIYDRALPRSEILALARRQPPR
jgi:RNA polymerase sigma-70 factor (ECF subfamily)